jgi:hypothetical protein
VGHGRRSSAFGARQGIALVVIALVAGVGLVIRMSDGGSDRVVTTVVVTARDSAVVAEQLPKVTTARSTSERAAIRRPTIGFRSAGSLRSHWQKHRSEFGHPSEAEYLRMAQTLRDAPLSDRVIETTQQDGSRSRFDRRTGGFIAFNRDWTIRTFFRPDDGEDYFRRAAQQER